MRGERRRRGQTMLDKRTAAVLETINALSAEGTYIIVELSDIVEALPRRLSMDEGGIREALSYLKDRGYISIKYADEREYCLCPLPRGRQYVETQQNEKNENRTRFTSYLRATFFGAMLGALIGGAIVAAVVLLLVR